MLLNEIINLKNFENIWSIVAKKIIKDENNTTVDGYIFFIKIRFSLFEFSNKILIKIKGKLNKKRYLLNNEYLFKNTNKKTPKKK